MVKGSKTTRLFRAAALLAAAPALLGLVVAATGCGGGDSPRGGTLDGSMWVLVSRAADGALTAVPSTVYADLSFADGTAGGSAGVNSFSGTYEATDKGSLTFGPLMATQMAGPEEAMAVETAVMTALAEVAEYHTDGEVLKLYDADGTEVLEYAKDTSTLAGSWIVTGYNNGKEGVMSVAPDSELTAAFAEDGSLTGSAGVNTYNTTYTTSDSTIEIGPIITTRMAGPEDLMDQEALYLAALENAATYSVRGPNLELRDDTGALQVSFATAARE